MPHHLVCVEKFTLPYLTLHIQDKPGVLLSKEKKKWEGGDQRGRLPAYATPQRGAAIAEAVPKHNSQTRSGPGGLGGSLPDRRCTGLSPRRWELSSVPPLYTSEWDLRRAG